MMTHTNLKVFQIRPSKS